MLTSSIKRTFIAVSAALAMSTVTVGAAVGPAQAQTPVLSAINA